MGGNGFARRTPVGIDCRVKGLVSNRPIVPRSRGGAFSQSAITSFEELSRVSNCWTDEICTGLDIFALALAVLFCLQ